MDLKQHRLKHYVPDSLHISLGMFQRQNSICGIEAGKSLTKIAPLPDKIFC